jgi:16S rRNA (cytidine1402-2'-O)-methyltransferase
VTGTLRICATPIGNLGDLTPRVAAALATAAVVACEDTRRTGTLLAAAGSKAPLQPLHDHNEHQRTPALVARLLAGEDVCLVSDAGLPAISDPGRTLIAAAIAAGVAVEVLPGASAVQAALVASGLAADRYAFVGFLPRSRAALERTLDELDGWGLPVVCFEAPSRLPAALRTIAARAPERAVAVCRELTKLHEEVLRGSAAELAERVSAPPRGEVTLVLGAVEAAPPASRDAEAAIAELRAAGIGARRASALVAGLTGLDRRALYRLAAGAPPAAGPPADD